MKADRISNSLHHPSIHHLSKTYFGLEVVLTFTQTSRDTHICSLTYTKPTAPSSTLSQIHSDRAKMLTQMHNQIAAHKKRKEEAHFIANTHTHTPTPTRHRERFSIVLRKTHEDRHWFLMEETNTAPLVDEVQVEKG